MAQKKIALDAMGGDHGPVVTVAAAKLALDEIAGIELVLVGDRDQLEAEVHKHNLQQNALISIHHASEVVDMDDLPVVALKKKKDSSMRVAINLVKEGKVQACVSAGNTGALMATSKFVLKTIRGISRPAICTVLPGINGRTHMLDLGANPDCTPENLAEFALMGSILVQSVDGIRNPRVGLLNIGSEEMKGNETIKRAAQLIAESRLNYYGFVEGDDIYKGTVDVIVTDGFVGNVSLKTGEGLAALVNHVLQTEFRRNWLTRLSAICAMPVLSSVKRRLDPRRYNGASLLGLNGIVIKSHGSADMSSFLNAIKIAEIEVENNVPQRISTEIDNYFSQVEEAVT
ncbi:MAG: phosphate acyltransferase PlsX [Gammaproteobacteria bacterium]|nr:phosphate acyltransferase PlsX [Gammaproteobacteria bacterium]MDH3449234.1 phosphate acyltransferase PlsX [Gammaproteobacteria bacterium]